MSRATQEVMDQYERYVMGTYVRSPLVVTKAKGSRVWDVDGREYLDLFPGWGVSGLGYNHPWVMTALRGQSRRVVHVSNNYYHPLQGRAAKALVERAFDGRVFFCNSGAEAVETAIKLAHRWGPGGGGPSPRSEVIVLEGSFHGRTMGALSATGQSKHQEGFEPLLPGFVRARLNDLASVERAVSPNTSAVLVEVVQGEGGIRVATEEFLRGVRRVCEERRLLLVADEIQTGMGRTGTWFAYQHSGVVPDVMLLGKMVAGGFPLGAVLARPEAAARLTPGTHAATYGGNPLGCACVLAVCEAIERGKLLDRVKQLGSYAMRRLLSLKERQPLLREVRGRGLMLGIELSVDGRPLVEACRAHGVLINCTQERVLRLLPAMTITKAQLSRGLGVVEEVLAQGAAAPR